MFLLYGHAFLQREEFTCHSDGACVSMSERWVAETAVRSKDCVIIPVCRCDQFPNCADFSDEAACQLVVLPDNYVSDYAPFTVDTDTGRMRRIGVKIKVAATIMLHFRHSLPCRWISFPSWASTK